MINIIVPGNIVRNKFSEVEIPKPSYKKYLCTCKNCNGQFEAESIDFNKNYNCREIPGPYVICPCCGSIVYKGGQKRIKK